jgi:hypothetical protein
MSIMERMPLRALSPEVIITQRIFVAGQAAALASPRTRADRSAFSIECRATNLRRMSTDNWIHAIPARPLPLHEGALGSHANLTLFRSRFRTLARHHQAFTCKTWWLRGHASMLTATQKIIANQYTSGVACCVCDRNRRQSTDSTRPYSWQKKPRMNDLGIWAEL